MLYLPKNLAALVPLAGDGGRFASDCVRVIECKDDWYRLEVTDGRVLAVVQGPSLEPDEKARDRPDPEVAAGLPNGAADALVPAKEFARCLKAVPRDGCGVALFLASPETSSFVVGGETLKVVTPQGLRFPNVDRVLPRHPPLLSFSVSPGLLARLLLAAEKFLPGDHVKGVSVLYYGPDRPVGVCCRTDAGQTFDALIMPLTQPKKEGT